MPAYDRRDRVSQEIMRQLYEAIMANKDLEKPAVFSVLRAEVSRDMRECKVFMSMLGSEDERAAFLAQLTRHAPALRAALGARVRLHHTPALHFFTDDSIEHAVHIGQVIDSLNIPKADPEPTEPDDEP